MQEVRELVSGARDFPPGHQWADRPAIWFPWKNMVTVGLGPALGLAGWAGWAWAGWELWRRRERRHLVPWLWVAIVFLHQGTQWVRSMRYLLPIYPMIALFAGWLVVGLWRRGATDRTVAAATSHRWRRRIAAIAGAGGDPRQRRLGVGVHQHLPASALPHRGLALDVRQHRAAGRKIAVEVWDDPLPLRIDGKDAFSIYHGVEVHGYAEDDPRQARSTLVTALDAGRRAVALEQPSLRQHPAAADALPDDGALLPHAVLGRARLRARRRVHLVPAALRHRLPRSGGRGGVERLRPPARADLREDGRVGRRAGAAPARRRRRLGRGIQRLWPRDIAGYKPAADGACAGAARRARAAPGRARPAACSRATGWSARLPCRWSWILVLLLLGVLGVPAQPSSCSRGLADRGFLVARGARPAWRSPTSPGCSPRCAGSRSRPAAWRSRPRCVLALALAVAWSSAARAARLRAPALAAAAGRRGRVLRLLCVRCSRSARRTPISGTRRAAARSRWISPT